MLKVGDIIVVNNSDIVKYLPSKSCVILECNHKYSYKRYKVKSMDKDTDGKFVTTWLSEGEAELDISYYRNEKLNKILTNEFKINIDIFL